MVGKMSPSLLSLISFRRGRKPGIYVLYKVFTVVE